MYKGRDNARADKGWAALRTLIQKHNDLPQKQTDYTVTEYGRTLKIK